MAKIIIVDDSKFIAKTISGRLKDRGHEIVAIGSDGEEGLRLFQEHRPDLTLLDVTMPNKDGRECLAGIMKLDPKAKVVMLSSVSVAEVVAECLRIGARTFIQKEMIAQKDAVENQVEQILAQAS